MFLLRSLELPQILELAQHLTLNRIDFFLPSPKVLVLDLVGVPTATLIRLLHYSEIPIPTSMSQGAFSISFLNFGDNRRNGGSFNGQHFKVTCGRISALHSVPMQIRWEDIRHSCEPTIEQSNIQKWLKTEFQGSCPQKVLSINEEGTVDWYLHFHVPQKLEATFPKQVCLEGKKILVEHALPFAPVRSNISRLPVEESMHEHWKSTASLAPAQKKNRSNCIAHVENCFPSLQRVNMLQEISIKSRGLKFTGSFEASSSPFLFINGVPKVEDGLQSFVSITGGLPGTKMEPPVRVLPICPLIVLAMSGACVRLRKIQCAAAFLLCFDTLLRPGELYALRKHDFTWAGGKAVVSLRNTKTGQRKGAEDMVVCHSRIANMWLQRALAPKSDSDPLLSCSAKSLRNLFFAILEHLGIQGHFSMYSFRRGGATWHFLSGGSMEETLLRGRWQSSSTARIVLQDAAATLTHLQITLVQRSYMKQLSNMLRARSQRGVRGRQ